MARARYQILVIPYYIQDDQVQFCLFRRSDMGIWQLMAGGGVALIGGTLVPLLSQLFG